MLQLTNLHLSNFPKYNIPGIAQILTSEPELILKFIII
jgi:hypothetical protein